MLGFFDSGVGGLTVLEAFRQHYGEFSFHYFADTAHCPYGDRPLNEVEQFALNATGFLAENNCSSIIMACNISSSVALESARKNFPGVNVYGLINDDLVQSVKRTTNNGRVGVLATKGTVDSNRYGLALEKAGLEVYQQPCSPLVPMIESGHLDGPLVEQTLDPLLQPVREFDADTIVMGCTHYPFLVSVIQAHMGPKVNLIDPGKVLAKQFPKLVDTEVEEPERSYWISGETESISRMLDKCFGRNPAHIEVISPDKIN